MVNAGVLEFPGVSHPRQRPGGTPLHPNRNPEGPAPGIHQTIDRSGKTGRRSGEGVSFFQEDRPLEVQQRGGAAVRVARQTAKQARAENDVRPRVADPVRPHGGQAPPFPAEGFGLDGDLIALDVNEEEADPGQRETVSRPGPARLHFTFNLAGERDGAGRRRRNPETAGGGAGDAT
jgi:hypothetical protein